MRRFRVSEIPSIGGRVLVPSGASHHLLRVVGIGRGEALGLFDGAGGAAIGVLVDVVSSQALIEVTAAVPSPAAPAPTWLLQGLPRHDAFDLIVRMGTELGVAHLWPVLTTRSVARGDRRDRWLRIAEAAAAQSGRAEIPEIRAPLPLASALIALPPGIAGRVYVPGASAEPPASGPAALLLGPEGGLTEEEIDLALAHGFLPDGLGPFTLRADTAAVAALSRRSIP